MHANLYGDFVKGNDLSQFPPEVQYGIRLHREIDSFIDNHPIVKEVLHLLYPSLPKVSGIAVDLFFDHLLAKNWDNYSSEPLAEFVSRFTTFEADERFYPDIEFQYTVLHMKKNQWLLSYASLDGLQKACEGVSKRISFPNSLFNGRQVFEEHEEVISIAFQAFMKEAIPHFEDFHKQQNQKMH